MIRTWGQVRELTFMAAIVLLCLLVIPVAQAHAEVLPASINGTTAVTATTQQNNATLQQASEQKGQDTPKPKAKPSTKPRDKSVLDTEVLESPLAYFRDAFGSEEEDSDSSAKSGAVMITLKALMATLLSTVM
ncbi:hypothetical protein [Pontibacter oryzae]|uniref:Uncharacterized protein n=1 Tax=Pontibacter oryzae TaxID=2304593 RepID=A0A399S4Q2_9BACT|nr:hypothetical protein [Pontibacter oryzae]RIJ37569.1 hypothetical protein D1627_10695 [Pontibacter oryzae]